MARVTGADATRTFLVPVIHKGEAAPTVADDSTRGFQVGDEWYTATDVFKCVSNEDGNATWKALGWAGEGGGGGGDSAGSANFFDYSFNETLTAPPGGGQIRLNNLDQKLATLMWIHHMTAPGVDVTHVMDLIVQQGGKIAIQDKDNSTRWQRYDITGPPVSVYTHCEVPITWTDGGDPLPAGQRALVAIVS